MPRIRRALLPLVALVLACGLFLAPAPARAAEPTFGASPASGPAGSDFTFVATGMPAGMTFAATVTDEGGQVTGTTTVTADDNGTVTGTVTPTTPGLRTITLASESIAATVTIAVTQAIVATDAPSYGDGGTVGVAAGGLAANAPYILRIADAGGAVTAEAAIQSDASGAYVGTLTVSGAGDRTVTILTAANAPLCVAAFTVVP